MNVNKIYAVAVTCGLFLLSSCNKFDEINTNPDATTDANATMLATSVILKNLKFSGRDAMAYVSDNGVAKYVAFANQSIMPSQYGQFGASSFGGMTILPNIEEMERYASGIPAESSFRGLAKFSRAYMFYQTTMAVGDIPYSAAGKGMSEGIIDAPYDLQEDVFKGILQELKEAEQYFANGITFTGDPTPYAGDPAKWRRAVNAFRLRVLLSLSKKVGSSSIDIVKEFADIVAAGQLMEAETGHLGLNYSAINMHPLFSTNNVTTSRTIVSSLLVDQLKAYNDRRLFYYAEPAAAQLLAGKTADQFDAYAGAAVEANYDVVTAAHLAGAYSIINLRYQQNTSSDPRMVMTYAEQQFILAEARILGWINTGSAADYYRTGTAAALAHVMGTTASYAHGMPIDQGYIDSYFTGETAFKSTATEQLQQIWWQKYLMNYMQNPIQSYFEYRRTGFPVFPIDPATSMNENKRDAIPVRWMYPATEGTQNQQNLMQALDRQYGGVDEVNQLMWLLK